MPVPVSMRILLMEAPDKTKPLWVRFTVMDLLTTKALRLD